MTDNIELTHRQARVFQPEKLSPPRNFVIPDIITDNKDNLPLMLEIGAGKGKHALSFVSKNPNKHLIAIERTRNKFDAFAKLAALQNIPNLDAIHADAIAWIVHAIAPSSVAKIFILYPNPEQHNPNQQWLNMPFFEFLLSRLQDGGEVVLVTNIESYMDNAEQRATEVWCLPNHRYQVPLDSQRTHFEVKYIARGETCWELNIHKPQGYKTRFDGWQANYECIKK